LRGVSFLLLKRVKTKKVVSVPRMVFNSAVVIANRLAARPREFIEVMIEKNKSRRRSDNSD
jgi:cell shape-determining protein MreC